MLIDENILYFHLINILLSVCYQPDIMLDTLLTQLPWWFRWYRICLQCGRPGFDPWVGKIPLEKEMATCSSILAWEIPWTEQPGGLQSMGLQRVGHNWATNTQYLLRIYHVLGAVTDVDEG